MGRLQDNLDSAEHTLALYRALAGPDAGPNPDLADALHTLALALIAVGRPQAALPHAEEAVRIYRDLVATDPHDYEPAFARVLDGFATLLRTLDRGEDALDAALEAFEVFQRVAETTPAADADMAGALNNLAMHLGNGGEVAEAATLAAEAARRYRTLSATDPARHLPSLAMALNNLAAYERRAGKRTEAMAAATEAVALYRDLSAADPEGYEPALARSLAVLHRVQLDLGQQRAAFATIREAMAILQPNFLDMPAAHAILMTHILADYRALAASLGRLIEPALLTPVLEALQDLEDAADAAERAADDLAD